MCRTPGLCGPRAGSDARLLREAPALLSPGPHRKDEAECAEAVPLSAVGGHRVAVGRSPGHARLQP